METPHYRPFTPLLIVVLFIAVVFATIAVAAAYEIVSLPFASIVAVTAMVFAARSTRIMIR
jgi:hypothetical protein